MTSWAVVVNGRDARPAGPRRRRACADDGLGGGAWSDGGLARWATVVSLPTARAARERSGGGTPASAVQPCRNVDWKEGLLRRGDAAAEALGETAEHLFADAAQRVEHAGAGQRARL